MALRINIPPLTRVLLVLLVGFSLLCQVASYRARRTTNANEATIVPWIALTPQISVYYPWVYLTSTFAEQNLITLLISGTTILYGGKYLERAWGSAELAKFLLIVTLIPNLIAAFLYIAAFAVTRSAALSSTYIQGSISIQAAFLVAFKQLVPEHTVTILKGVIKIRVKHFPAMFIVANTISGFVFFTDTAAILCWLGFLTSWTYLRFYKSQPDLMGTNTGGKVSRGDASETFAFAYFWPDIFHSPIAAVSDSIYNVLLVLKICTPFSAEEVETSNEQASARGEGGLPSLLNQGGRRGGGGGKREEAERRRALALKALDQRLQAATANRQQTTTSIPPATDANGERSPNADTSTEHGDESEQV